MNMQEFKRWHETSKVLLGFGIAQILVAYLLGSRAIDTGSLIEYFFTFLFLAGGLRNLFKLMSNIIHDNKHKATKTR